MENISRRQFLKNVAIAGVYLLFGTNFILTDDKVAGATFYDVDWLQGQLDSFQGDRFILPTCEIIIDKTVWLPSNIQFGWCPRAKLKAAEGLDEPMLSYDPQGGYPYGENIELANFQIDASGVTDTTTPVSIDANYSSAHHIRVTGGAGNHGIQLGGSYNEIHHIQSRRANLTVRNGTDCHIRQSSLYGLWDCYPDAAVIVSNCSNSSVKKVKVRGCTKAGIILAASPGAEAKFNDVAYTDLHGIYTWASPYALISWNKYKRCGTTNSHGGVTISEDYTIVRYNDIVDCIVGVFINKTNSIIEYNRCVDSGIGRQQYGIKENVYGDVYTDYNTIRKNYIKHWLTAAIHKEGEKTVVEDNIIIE
jgi:hypothetical protein